MNNDTLDYDGLDKEILNTVLKDHAISKQIIEHIAG